MRNQNQDYGFGGTEGLKDRLKENIASLTESSMSLRKAIIDRKPKVVWEILADQERKVIELERHTSLWAQLFGEKKNGSSPFGEEAEKVRDDVMRLRRIGDGNAYLANSYLSAVRKALQVAGTNIAEKSHAKTKVYGRSGRMNVKKSFLLRKEG